MATKITKLTLAEAIAACAEARAECEADIRKSYDWKETRWKHSREPRLLAIDADGERMDDSHWVTWRRRMKDVNEMIAMPGCVEVIVDSGIDFAATKEELENSFYSTEFWQVVLYKKEEVPDEV